MSRPVVRVWEAPGVADALAASTDLAVEASGDPPPWEEALACVVTAADEETVTAVRDAHPEGPVVTVGDVDEKRVAALYRDGVTEHVQAGAAESTVLARRVERIVDVDRATAGTPERYARLLEGLDAGAYLLNADGECTFVNEEICALTGYDESDLLGAGPRLVIGEATADAFEEAIVERLQETTDSVTVRRRVEVQREDGASVPCDVHVTVVRDADGEILAFFGVLRDATERERRQNLLAQLQESSQALMQAPSRETVAEIVADAAVNTLGFNRCTVRLYNADDRTLEPVAANLGSFEPTGERPVYGIDEGPPAAAFTSGETIVYDDVQTIDDGHDRPARAGLYVPMGVHGTLSLGSTETGSFDDVDRQISELLATNAAAACNRAKREQEVRDAREHIATIVERIEGLVEDTIEVLVQATTREELEAAVCARLTATDPWVHAWLARPDVREEKLRPAEGAGDHPAMADAAISIDGDSPGAVAYREGRSRVIDGETLRSASEGWLAAAREGGISSAVAIPLAHREASYGVIFVCAHRTDAFDERERVVLEALGRAMANAIDAIESGRILDTDEVVELSIAIEGETLLGRVSQATGATLSTVDTMTDDDAQLRLFLTATGAPAEAVHTALEADDAVASVTLVADLEEEALFDVALADSVVADVVERGALPKRVTAEGGVTRLTLEVPDERAARETFAVVERRHPATTLVGYRDHERPVRTRQEFRAALAERFTDRQETALRTAFHGGFFDWPRGADGDELADGMDISRPTYHQHLRAAQRKVFEELFGPETALEE